MTRRTLLILSCAALTVAVLAAPAVKVPALPPKYCQPVAYRDYEVGFGRAAFLRPLPGCTKPSLVRKVSDLTGEPQSPFLVPLPTPNVFPPETWLFISHLDYSLDGETWQHLRLSP
ncbi:hypothetical protein [Deinococcus ruber]|uniref:Secreted protein n=1 Tax=Deinococcus ruber TaxID=1848197 RepID=A0A918CA73_9DEIO|nr:hypothetical protein [Deinococcus ruber]GGR11334.1 hypothetical protein GCM10008957_25070 [Deinococcus ruber]